MVQPPPPLLSPTEALERILGLLVPLHPEWTPVEEAIGRAIVEEIRAQRTLPPWDNSAMDGFAVRSEDTLRAPMRLKIVDTIYAGQMPARAVGKGECSRIMTGGPMPDGADAVVMQEKTRQSGSSADVEIWEPVASGNFVRSRGEDAREGDSLLSAGTVLGIAEAGLLWAQGLTQVRVPRRPRVAILSSGDELCRVDEPPRGRIVDTNSLSLAALVRRVGGIPLVLGISADNLDELVAMVDQASSADVVLVSAGASVGERDLAEQALVELGVQIALKKVAIKPGKPIMVGCRDNVLYFGLPGNPASSLVCFELFVRPAIRRLLGYSVAKPDSVFGRTEVALQKPVGLTHYIRVAARARDGALWAAPLPTQTSGALRSASQATHLLVFPADQTQLPAGSPAELIPVSWVN